MLSHKDQEFVNRLIQDMRVKARDMEDFQEESKYKKVISKLEKGYKEEYESRTRYSST